MNKQEAIHAMKAGNKITHRFFSAHEYVKLAPDGRIETEDGYLIAPYLFWLDRKGDEWDKDWEIWKPLF
jgi:hypothetical protein